MGKSAALYAGCRLAATIDQTKTSGSPLQVAAVKAGLPHFSGFWFEKSGLLVLILLFGAPAKKAPNPEVF
jgi:hypothetical protein